MSMMFLVLKKKIEVGEEEKMGDRV